MSANLGRSSRITASFPTPDGPLRTRRRGGRAASTSLPTGIQLPSKTAGEILRGEKARDDVARIENEHGADFPMPAHINQLVAGLGFSNQALHRGGVRLEDTEHPISGHEVTAANRQNKAGPLRRYRSRF